MQISVECRGVAQLGSALVSGTRGREFESRRPDQIELQPALRCRFFVFKHNESLVNVQYTNKTAKCRLHGDVVDSAPVYNTLGALLNLLTAIRFYTEHLF